jgi:hypothetical protein
MSSFLEQGKKGWGDVVVQNLVAVTAIDSFCSEHGITSIDVLKLDVQGFELELIKGAKEGLATGRIGLLYFEVTFMERYKNRPSFSDLYTTAIVNDFELIAVYPLFYRDH